MGMAIVYGLKVNLSVAMVAMLNHTAIHHGSSLQKGASLGNISISSSLVGLMSSEDNSACSENSKAEAPEVRIQAHIRTKYQIYVHYYFYKLFDIVRHLVYQAFNTELFPVSLAKWTNPKFLKP